MIVWAIGLGWIFFIREWILTRWVLGFLAGVTFDFLDLVDFGFVRQHSRAVLDRCLLEGFGILDYKKAMFGRVNGTLIVFNF